MDERQHITHCPAIGPQIFTARRGHTDASAKAVDATTGCPPVALLRQIIPIIAITIMALPALSAELPFAPVFVHGTPDIDAVSRLADTPVNTIYIKPSDVADADLNSVKRRIEAAADHGLKAIVAIPTVSKSIAHIPSPGPGNYRQWVTHRIERVVGRFRDNPNVIAWATGDYLADAIDYNEADFRNWLKREYDGLDSLNQWWNTGFDSWGQVSQRTARKHNKKMPFGVGRARIDVARFRRQAFQRVMAHWAASIHNIDHKRPLMTGRMGLYRSLTAVPDDYDIVCPHLSPARVESDTISHNAHAIDMARRAGRFRVIPAISVPLTEGGYRSGQLRRWITVATVHGAAGIGLADYRSIQQSPAPRVIYNRLNTVLQKHLQPAAFRVRPTPTIAFLYEPIAGGINCDTEPAYGFLKKFSSGEPSNPFYDFKLGTIYGICDYLTLNDLPSADLDRYGVILAPACLRMPPDVATRLAAYVRRGGALVCDLGTGVYETNSWLQLPTTLRKVFGIRKLLKMQQKHGELEASWEPSWLPSVRRGTESRPARRQKNNDKKQQRGKWQTSKGTPLELKPYHVNGPVCHAKLAESAGAVAILSEQYAEHHRLLGGLIGHNSGSGIACFATHRLWANWDSGGPLYTAFHHDLCRRRRKIQLLTDGFWTAGICATATRGGAAFCNGTGASALAEAVYYHDVPQLYTEALCSFSARARHHTSQQANAMKLSVQVPPASTIICDRIPVTIQPYSGNCTGRVIEYGPDRIIMELAGGSSPPVPASDGYLHPSAGRATDLRITIRNGIYSVSHRSRHRVLVESESGTQRLTATASAGSYIRLSRTVSHARITIRQAPQDTG